MSTITQQLVKNAFLTPEKTITRKIKEAVLSYKIEKSYTKEEIFAFYLNQIPYGSNAYGAEAAAQTFFGKSASSLSLN
ncbi:MAG: biosynthetic peptidoglycan transglycosylase [Patescibacteria group bacterium]